MIRFKDVHAPALHYKQETGKTMENAMTNQIAARKGLQKRHKILDTPFPFEIMPGFGYFRLPD